MKQFVLLVKVFKKSIMQLDRATVFTSYMCDISNKKIKKYDYIKCTYNVFTSHCELMTNKAFGNRQYIEVIFYLHFVTFL